MLSANPITRPCCFAARDTLFKIPIFGRIVHSVNAIPIRRGQADLTAMRMFVERLKDGYGLVLYPEGTRTQDGKIAEIKPGFSLLARRASVPIIPSVIDGAYECWPKHKKLFSPGKVFVNYGVPIPPEKIAENRGFRTVSFETPSRRGQCSGGDAVEAGRVFFSRTGVSRRAGRGACRRRFPGFRTGGNPMAV